MKRGFTILELLVATALTALLMVAVLHVIGSLGRSRAALARQADTGAWRSDLLDTLRRDLTNATSANFRQDGIKLVGHGALDRSTLARSHEPVTVMYGLAVIHGRRWLVRNQLPRDGSSNAPGWTELLCPDISAFTVQPASSIVLGPVDRAQDGTPDEIIPPVVSVRLNGSAGQVMDETLVLR